MKEKTTDNIPTVVINIEDKRYPELLRQISAPPERLFCRGNTDLLNSRCISVAGSRKASTDGIRASEFLGTRLARCGITVVSGLAEGVDTAAHRGALAAGGNTIAVLANGLDQFYPAMNRKLQIEIEKKGLLISEYPDSTPARKYCFPQRNRIISGLSQATVITEAALRSGSLITAEAAAEQGRAVYAVAGNFIRKCCAGTNHLISDGASPIVDINRFLEEIGADPGRDSFMPEELSEKEMAVYRAVGKLGEPTTDQLVIETMLPSGMVNGILTVLEMKGYVETEMGRAFLSANVL